jgi:beta-phosphoglucomutase-like phosphatase (HAD superfamily)
MQKAAWAVIFDLDGVLVDSEPLQVKAFNVALAPHGISLTDEDFLDLVGLSTEENFRVIRQRHSIAESVGDLLVRKNAAYQALVRSELEASAGAPALVRELAARRIPIAVASSSPRSDVLLSLESVGLLDAFGPPHVGEARTRSGATSERWGHRAVATADDVEHPKPAPDLYLLAAQWLGMPPSACVAVEDSTTGLEAAWRAGIRCVVVPNRYTARQDFSRAAMVLSSLEQASLDLLSRLASIHARRDRRS